ncbi:TIR domain-containing protein [Phenylobacterium sp.]|jgi:tetratricopeptide (TPR) repeat protein|uniref:TIR domain-containing protein n=1 Tax=Phenylobacterium sp. TaxID=1871053 RepID=UPI002F923531
MSDIFLSYASKDRARVRTLVERLLAEGFTVWWDREIGSGAAWDSAIEHALEAARCVLVVWTEASISSDWVRTEANEARERGVLIPVLLDDVRMPLAFRRGQARNLVGWPSDHDRAELEQLIADMRQILRAPKAAQRLAREERTERRPLTVLRMRFASAAEAAADPEALDDWSSALEASLRGEAHRWGGAVVHFEAQGCCVAFGLGAVSEDGELRAAEAAFALAACARARGVDPSMGLSTGLAVVTLSPDPEQSRFTGPQADAAGALAQQAEPGQLLVPPAVQRRLSPYFLSRPATDGAFALLERSGVPDRLAAEALRGLSPLLGRRKELAALEAALAETLQGQGHAVRLNGDAGIGKSRLAHELRILAEDTGCLFLQTRCRAHEQARTHGPLSDMLREVLRLHDVPPADVESEALSRLRAIDPGLEPYLPHLLHLLSIASDQHRLPASLEGIGLRRALRDALVAVATLASRTTPLVLVFDDWQWADEASREALVQLAESCAVHPLMLLVCARPEAGADWPALPHCLQIMPRPLTVAEASELLRGLSGAAEIDEGLPARIHTQTDGVPLFVEELARALLDEGRLSVVGGRLVAGGGQEGADLPASVEAVIRSRLDRLDESVFEILRTASVIGRQFLKRDLVKLHGHEETVTVALTSAVAQGLIQQTRVVPEPEYRFRHHLTQLVAYESLLLKRRRELHRNLAKHLEQHHAQDLAPMAEVLAHHFRQAGLGAEAAPYLLQAGSRAARNAAMGAARLLFAEAVDLIAALPPSPERDTRLMQAYVALGNASVLVLGYAHPEVQRIYDEARRLGRHGSGESQMANLWMLWRYYYNRALSNEAGEFAGMMMSLAAESPDPGLGLTAHAAQGVIEYLSGQPDRALVTLEAGLALSRPETERELALQLGTSPTVQAWIFRALSLVAVGRTREGMQAFDTAADLGRSLEHPVSELLALGYLHGTLLKLEERGRAADVTATMMTIASRHELPHWQAHALMNQGEDLIEAGDLTRGLPLFRRTTEGVNAMGVALVMFEPLMRFARLAHAAGRTDEGLAILAQADELIQRGDTRYLEVDLIALRFEMLWSRDRNAALAEAARGFALADRARSRFHGLRLAAEVASRLAEAGRPDEALALLTPRWNTIAPEDRGPAIYGRMGVLIDHLRSRVAERSRT